MQSYRLIVNRLVVAAAVAGAILAGGQGLPAEAANPAVTTNLPTTVAIAPALSTVSVQPGGTDAWVTFTSTVPSTARVEVQQAGLKNIDPVMVASGTEPAGHHPIGGVGSPVATSVGAVNASDPVAPVYETTHKLHLTNLKPGTSYHASVSASTQAGDQLSSQVRFDTLQERVRITVDTIDLQHGGALFGDNTVWWYLGVSWGGTGYQPVSAQGSVTTCFPSNDSGDPMERVVGVCQTGSYGIHRIPLSYRLKVRQRCADRHREVPAPTGCNAHVFAEDGRPLLWRDQHEVNTAPKSLANNGVAMCSLDVLHPVRLRAEHRHEIAFALHGGDYHRIRAPATGPASTDF
jgi:hypothetical protein